MTAPILEVADVHKRYGAAAALRGVSLQVREGEMFGLLGPNGAGKTTLLSILSCLLEPTSGAVRLFGQAVTPSARHLRRQIGIVPQELAVYGELTARENLLFFGELYGLGGPTLRRRADEVLAAMGLADPSGQRVDTFSGGMKRRLNLGAALMHRPPLLLLDEPTVGVDPQSRHHIFEEVRRLNAAGATVVYTSHYMEEVQALCTRLGIIDEGRLLACDTLPGLLRMQAGKIRFRVPQADARLCERLRLLPEARLVDGCAEGGGGPGGQAVVLECADVGATRPQLLAALRELGVDLLNLEAEEPNLETVFLRLTGKALRD